jgi:SAM-dependent methyltransferase
LELLDEFKEYLKEPILDIGTRNGLLLEELEKRGYPDAIGIEVTDIADHAKSMGRNVVKGDIQKRTEWEDGHFHSAIATQVIEHFNDPEAGIKEIRRILDGYIYINFPIQSVAEAVSNLRFGHYTTFESMDDMVDLLKRNGFEIVKTDPKGSYTYTIIAKTI